MVSDENKAVVRRYYEDVLNAGDIDALNALAIVEYVEHDPLPGQGDGRDGLRRRVEMLRSAFRPHFTIEDMIAEHDKVVVRWTNRGVHVAEPRVAGGAVDGERGVAHAQAGMAALGAVGVRAAPVLLQEHA